MSLPPGQQPLDRFPRFGTHLHKPPPAVPAEPGIEITGAVSRSVTVSMADVAAMPRVERTADFHCVAGWSATGLRWEGVSFATFYRTVIEPVVAPEVTVTHLVVRGLDGYRSVVTLQDALEEDVLIADGLDGAPLSGDHGAPLRFVSPSQYGFISTKHLCRIELHTTEPRETYHPALLMKLGLALVKPHERARVWEEERHRFLPARLLRPVYRLLIPPIRKASAQTLDQFE